MLFPGVRKVFFFSSTKLYTLSSQVNLVAIRGGLYTYECTVFASYIMHKVMQCV